MADRIRENLIVARQRPQLVSGCLIEIAESVGRDVGIEPVGLGEHDVERDRDGAQPGQVGDEIRDPRPRPGPLAEFGQAFFVDIDDSDRPYGLHAGIDALEGVEGSDPQFLDRREIGDAQRRDSDQEHEANQSRIAELSAQTTCVIPSAASCYSDITLRRMDHVSCFRNAPDRFHKQRPHEIGEPAGGRL